MITVGLAKELVAAGVLWEPTPGDRFVIDRDTLHGQVFWISDLTVEVHHFNDQSVLGFNGTTEWALDSVSLDQALWLPREDQLRALLGDRIGRISPSEDGWTVRLVDGTDTTDPDLECAYAQALLTVAAP